MIAAKIRELHDQRAKDRQAAGRKKGQQKPVVEEVPPREKGKARDHAAAIVGVSGRLVDDATKLLNEAKPELVKAVDDGRVSIGRVQVTGRLVESGITKKESMYAQALVEVKTAAAGCVRRRSLR
jgi:hypothetical protein